MSKIKKIGLGIVGFFVLIIIIAAVSGGDKTETNNQDQTSNPQATQATAPKTKSYQQVFTFSGNGAKKSEPFTITGDRFKISYDCKGDLCQAFLYKVNSNIPEVFMNTTGSTKDETIIYGSGEYYIQANTLGSYMMTVYDYR